MTENRNHDAATNIELPFADTAELKSNQSVRATFRLSENTILALNIVSNQLGIKQKSLFDHLIADTDALETIAREIRKIKQRRSSGIQKTYVISRKTLSTLQKMAETYKTPRDALVEFSIQRLKPVIEEEKEKLDTRRKMAAKVKREVDHQKNLLKEAVKKLGTEDPVCEQLSTAVSRLENAYMSIMAFVKKSAKIAELSP